MAEPTRKNRLDSWKEIAAYLQRDERTAIRWAKERGMPVHHVPGPRRGRAFAYPEEIDAWLNHQPAEAVSTAAEPAVTGRRPLVGSITAAILAGALLLALVWAGFRVVRPSASELPERVAIEGNKVVAWDAHGGRTWEYEFPQPLRKLDPVALQNLERMSRVVDLDGDGRPEVLLIADLSTQQATAQPSRRVLYCFSSQGKLLWSYEPEVTLRFRERDFAGPWSFSDILITEEGERKAAWLLVAHHLWWPSFIVKLDPHGQPSVRFINSGTLYSLNYVKNSTGSYVLAGGFNNEYDAGILAVLNEKQPFAASPQSSGSQYVCDGCPEGRPSQYFVFPRSELNRLEHIDTNEIGQILVFGDRIEVSSFEISSSERAIYTVPAEFGAAPLSLNFSDTYWRLHRRLEEEGKISHSTEDCPERAGPPEVREWRAGAWHVLPVSGTAPGP